MLEKNLFLMVYRNYGTSEMLFLLLVRIQVTLEVPFGKMNLALAQPCIGGESVKMRRWAVLESKQEVTRISLE